MDVSRIDDALAEIRAQGDCALALPPLVGDAFRSIPPHRVGVAHLTLKPRFLLADPTGTGKTPQCLVAYATLRHKQPSLRLLVVTPRAAQHQWLRAAQRFTRGLSARVVGYAPGASASTPERRQADYASDADILITTYHSMARDCDVILSTLRDFVVAFDEAQTLKSADQRMLYPAALRLSYAARYVWGLSATPISNRLEELHAIMHVIYPGVLGSPREFMDRYVDRVWVKLPRGGFWRIRGYRHLNDLMERMRPYYIKRPVDAFAAHLPAVVTQEVQVDLSPEERRIYDAVEAQHFPPDAQRDGKPLSKLASLTYAQMAAIDVRLLGYDCAQSAKIRALVQFLADNPDDSVIVFSRFTSAVTRVADALAEAGIATVRITGDEDTDARNRAQASFQAGDARVCLITAAGGTALDLQRARLVVFLDLPWSWAMVQQVIGRARRTGSGHASVLAVFLVASQTIDEAVLGLLGEKEDLIADTIERDTRDLLFDGADAVGAGPDVVDRLYRLTAGKGATMK